MASISPCFQNYTTAIPKPTRPLTPQGQCGIRVGVCRLLFLGLLDGAGRQAVRQAMTVQHAGFPGCEQKMAPKRLRPRASLSGTLVVVK